MSPVTEAVRAQSTALYRLYDEGGQLLYVGISNDPDHRWTQHATDKPWWSLVSQRTVEWHPNRGEAEKAERAAVKTEGPLYNSAGAKRSMLDEHFPLDSSLTYSRAMARFADVLDGTQHHSQHWQITRRGKPAGYVVPPEWWTRAVEALEAPAPPAPEED